MANVDRPNGLRPVQHLSGASWNGKVTPYLVTDANAMYSGDVVTAGGSAGAAGAYIYGQSVEGMPTITRCTQGDGTEIPIGVVVSFLPLQPLQDVNYKAADATDRVALVCDDPFVIFEAQEDAAADPLDAADVGLNVSFTVTGGSTTTGQSGMEIDSSSHTTTSTVALRLIGLSKRADNAINTAGAADDEAKWLVVFNAHKYNLGGVTGA